MTSFQVGKFSPPRFEPGRHLPRNRIISHIQAQSFPLGRSILIEGQAGQGKSQLAIQFLTHTGATFTWFQLGKEDADPVLLLTELVQALQMALPGFVSTEVDGWLAQGSQVPENCQQIVNALRRDLEDHLADDFFLVFDDLHLLGDHEQSLQVISSLLTGVRRKFHLILISRLPVLPALKIEQSSVAIQVVNNDDLALNRQEVAELFNVYFKIPVSSSAVNDLYQANEGWIMGLVLAAQRGSGDYLQPSPGEPGKYLNRQAFLDYFSREVLLKLPEELREDLIGLSLLDEVPTELARAITGKPDIAERLRFMEDMNFFVRSLDQAGTIFSFHHLFKECLSLVAWKEKGSEAVQEVLNKAGQWYRESMPEKALSYFLRSSNYSDSQSVLGRVGMQLLANNRLTTLREFLSQVPDDVLQDFPWLSFYHGVVCLSTAPPAALAFLERARECFIQEGNETGELAALVQLIFFHTAVDCQFKRGQVLLERAIHLYEKIRATMAEDQKVHAANVFLLGLTFFGAEIDRTREFADFGLTVAQELGLKELHAEARVARSYRDLFAGNLSSCRKEIDGSLELLKDPQVSLINKGALQLAQLNLLVNEGDLAGYEYHRDLYRDTYGEELVDQSSFGAIMRMWEMDLALARGNEAKIEETLGLALASEFGCSLPHMRSLYLHYQAYLLARQNKEQEALSALEESRELRNLCGGREFVVMNLTLLGGTLTRLGRFEEALALLREGLETSELIGEHFVRPGVFAQRAWLHLKQGNRQAAGNDIHSMLYCLQQSGFTSFYGWDPEVMEDLLLEAVRQQIKPDFVRDLAARRLGLVVGEGVDSFPLLQVHSLGPFYLTCRGVELSAADTSPSMRQLLAFLIAAPGHSIDQESAQHALWPEESQAKGRSNFDTLVSRIRKLLQQTFPKVKAKEVLNLKKGVLCLKHCWIDIDDFRQFIRQGLSQARNKNCWQAGNALRRGLNLWRGEFFGKSSAEIDFGQTRSDLLRLFLDGSMEQSRLLAANRRLTEAIEVTAKAVGFEPTNETLVRQLYELQIQDGKPHLANQVMQNYAGALRSEDCTTAEIHQLLESFWAR